MKTVGHNHGDVTPQDSFGHVWGYISLSQVGGLWIEARDNILPGTRELPLKPQQRIIPPGMSIDRRLSIDRKWYNASYMDYRINIPYEGGTAESLLPGSRLGTKSTH